MKVFDGLDSITVPIENSSAAIGTFDGVHIGHQAIIKAAVRDARAQGRPSVVFTFDRHPAELLAPERVPGYLTTPHQRNAIIAELGADALVIARFDTALSNLSPDDFVKTILKALLGARTIVVGANFLFGKGRAGNIDYLRTVQARFDFALHAIEPVLYAGLPASSTRIREALRQARILEAESMLGRPYTFVGGVVHGQQLGRTLGYPTANLDNPCRQIIPGDGIYAVLVTLPDGRGYGGACSIGNRPTIEGAGRSMEVYLLDFDGDLYGQQLEVRFVKRLREEEKYDSLEALKEQMARDVLDARRALA